MITIIKYNFFFFLFLFSISHLVAQETEEFVITGSFLKINNNATVTTTGNSFETINASGGTIDINSTGTLVASGDITNNSGGKISIDGLLQIESNWVNDGIANVSGTGLSTGTVEFSGSTNQNIGGSVSTEFESIHMNNAAGVTLLTDQYVSQYLNFSSGVINTGLHRLELTSTSDQTFGYGDNKYVSGMLRKHVTTATEYHLPVGDATKFELAELYIYSQTGLNYVDITFTPSDQNPVSGGLTVNGILVDEFLDYGLWTIIPNAGMTSVSYNLALQSTGHTDKGGSADNYSLIANTGSGWQSLGVHSPTTQTYSSSAVTAKRQFLTSFGNYVLGFSSLNFYTPFTETEEISINSSFFKICTNANTIINNTGTILNNVNSGIISIQNNATLECEGNINNVSSSQIEISANGSLISNAPLYNSFGSSITVDGTAEVKSDWTNDGVASIAGSGTGFGTINFCGTTNQNIGGLTPTIFENVTVSNTSGITLTCNQSITNNLTFTNGTINTSTNRLDLTATSDAVSGYGDGNYIIGNLRKYITTGVNYHLPIGNTSYYEEAELYVYSHTGLNYVDLLFTVSNENPVPVGLTADGIAVDEFLDYGYWTLTPNAGYSDVSYNITIQSKGHTDKGGSADNYSLISNLGSGWQDLGTHSPTTQIYSTTEVTAKRQFLNTFGSYIVGYSTGSHYTPFTETEELIINSSYFKVCTNGNLVVNNSIFAINVENNATVEIQATANLETEGIYNNSTNSVTTVLANGILTFDNTLNNTNGAILEIQQNGLAIVHGNVNNFAGSNIEVDGTLQVKADWINDGTPSVSRAGATMGTIEFSGTALQSIGGSVETVFENIAVNNTAGISLANNQTISNNLVFTSGLINTTTNYLEITKLTDDALSGYGDGKYINGTLRRFVTSATEYNIPVGNATMFELSQVYINSHTGLNYIDISFTESNENPVPMGLLVGSITVDEFLDYGYWNFTPNAGYTSVNYNVAIQSKGHTDKGGTADNYSLISDIGSGWQDVGIHSPSTQTYSMSEIVAKRQQLSVFGKYLIGYSVSSHYTPFTETDELLIDASYFKICTNGNSTINNSSVTVNVENSSTVEIQNTATFTIEGQYNNNSGSTTSVLANGTLAIHNKLNNINGSLIDIQENGIATAYGNIDNLAGSSIEIDGTLNVKANWKNNATASVSRTGATLGLVEFSGILPQTVGGTVSSIFENFTINNSAGVTFLNNQTVTNNLTFSQGRINTGTNHIAISKLTDNAISGYGDGQYINGTLRRYINTVTEYNLPVGNASIYELAQVYVNSHTGLNYIDVSFTPSNENPSPVGLMVSGVTVDEFLDYGYWNITPNIGYTSANYNLMIQSKGHTDKGGSSDNYSLITDIGSGWQDIGIHSPTTQIYSVTSVIAKRQQLTSFGSYLIGYSSSSLYTPFVETNELMINSSYYKVCPNGKSIINNASFAVNVENNATVEVQGTATLSTDGNYNNNTSSHTYVLSNGDIAILGDLNNNNAATVNIPLNGIMTVYGDIYNHAGSAIEIDGTLSAKSNWTNNGTPSVSGTGASLGTVEFSGTLLQTIGGSVATVFENFTVNNLAGITLTNDQSISNNLVFSQGKITTGTYKIEVTKLADNAITGYGNSKYINGKLRRYISPSASYNLPLGDGSNYEFAQIYISSQTGLNYIDASFTTSNQNPVPVGITVNGQNVDEFLDYGYWTLTPNAGYTNVNYNLIIKSNGHTDKGGTSDNYSMISDIGFGWQDYGLHSSSTQDYTASVVTAGRQLLNTFGNFIIAYSMTPLYVSIPETEDFLVNSSYFKLNTNGRLCICGASENISIENNSTFDVKSTAVFTSESSINIESSSNFSNAGNLIIQGDLINNASFSGTGTTTFSGTTDQNIGGSNSCTFANLTINNPGGNLLLAQNTTVTGTLNLTDGIIETGLNSLICTSTLASAITGYSANSFIFGTLIKSIATNTNTYGLPIGNSNTTTGYHLVEFINNNLTGITALTVSVNSFTETGDNIDSNIDTTKCLGLGTVLDDVISDAIWSIIPTGSVSGGSYGLNIYLANMPSISDLLDNKFTLVKRPNGSTSYEDWDAFDASTTIPADNAPGRIYSGGSGYASKLGFTSFSEVAVATSLIEALPIELLSFSAILKNDIVSLNWKTLSEYKNDYFIIEKTSISDLQQTLEWETVLETDGAGFSNKLIEYSGYDENPFYGVSYYRLKQVDFDGKYEYSQVITINNFSLTTSLITSINVSPNPCHNQKINIYGKISTLKNEKFTLLITTINGQILFNQNILTGSDGFIDEEIDKTIDYEKGTYLIYLYNNMNSYYSKLIIK